MRTNIAMVVMAIAALGCSQPVAHARPVTYEDLAGKKICWSHENTTIFRSNGTFIRNRRGETIQGTWRISSIVSQDSSLLTSKTPQFERSIAISKQGRYYVVITGFKGAPGVFSAVHGVLC
jgi:hypothetical protein